MNVFFLPCSLCAELERMMNGYWWGYSNSKGRGIRWFSWEKLCMPKKFGGLGFKHLHEFNLSMVAKQAWRLLINPSSLVARIFKAKYFPYTSFLNAKLGSNPSYIRRSLMAT